jgi:STE24 endopeptidase
VTRPSPSTILIVFIAASVGRQVIESLLAAANRRFYRDPRHQEEARLRLGLSEDEVTRAVSYADDRLALARVADWTRLLCSLTFIAAGGLGWVEGLAQGAAVKLGLGPLSVGLLFFASLSAAGELLSLPFAYYATFRLEARHGFNRQTRAGFVLDHLKAWALGAALGGPLLAAVLFLLQAGGRWWWLYAWGVVTLFSLLALFIYPRLLAPLFNRFSPLPEGSLSTRIHALADKVGFRTSGVFVMDASRRTSHGNAYFTGLFREKRIVLFDTLLSALDEAQIVAVLAHELGHFKLHHVRSRLWRSLTMTGVTFFLLSLSVGWAPFYDAFGLRGPSAYGALVVFGAWFSLLDFLVQPIGNAISRRHELAADAFAVTQQGSGHDLAQALLRLREQSRSLPLYHPLFSRIYHSHPPLLERLRALQ